MPVAGRRIELWVEARDGIAAVNPVIRALLDILRQDGAMTVVRVTDHEVVDVDDLGWEPAMAADVILLKSATSVALALAAAAEAGGVPCLNHARPTLRAHDKAATIARLDAAGLPVPETLLADPSAPMSAPADSSGSWVSKPVSGIHGQGVTFHDAYPTTLDVAVSGGDHFVVDDGVRVIQRRVGGVEPDVKVYVADRRCFVGSKQFNSTSFQSDQLTRGDLDVAVTKMVLAVGEVLELRCFGVDLRSNGHGFAIIDANPFPGYRGCPDALPALRREVGRALNDAPS